MELHKYLQFVPVAEFELVLEIVPQVEVECSLNFFSREFSIKPTVSNIITVIWIL